MKVEALVARARYTLGGILASVVSDPLQTVKSTRPSIVALEMDVKSTARPD